MPTPLQALRDTAARITERDPGRAEATLQADIRQFILLSNFDLSADEVQSVNLESQLGDGTRRRIDIEAGNTVIEVKKDLRTGNVLTDAVEQLQGYVSEQSRRLDRRYVGVLTDGVEWRLYHLNPETGTLSEVSTLTLSSGEAAVETLTTWLDTILATAHNIAPTPLEIERRLGVTSASYQLDRASLRDLYRRAQHIPEVQLKRELWAKLLRTSFGTSFTDDEELFIDHTLLVLMAEVIAHAVVGYDLATQAPSPAKLASGELFAEAQIHGVVEADFFDWVLAAEGGPQFVTSLAQRLARFNWDNVSHDVLKVLYESVISPQIRHSLGEYYTPDWLANRVIAEVVTDPLRQRVLDPACGSGTFIFQAVKKFLGSADAQQIGAHESLSRLTSNVFGMDVHPVAVTFARVTYLLAIGTERLRHPDRGPLSIPVYLGDSVQWDQRSGTLSGGTINIPTSGNDLSDAPTGFLFETDLSFPESIVEDASRFDQIVTALADKATTYDGGDRPAIKAILNRFKVSDEEAETLTNTFDTLCHLHASGRDHIWGYYVRNLIRPLWLSNSSANQVDVLVGNPPWLRYASMTATMQTRFTELSTARQLITTRRGVSGRDLSSLFVARAVELYLRPGGSFGFVMPHAALTRQPYEGFRRGNWASVSAGDLAVTFQPSWDLHRIQPDIFPVPACVVFGTSTPGNPHGMTETTIEWAGRLPSVTVDWQTAETHLTTNGGEARQVTAADTTTESPYKQRFRQGAVLAPRALLFVEQRDSNPLGVGAGRAQVAAYRSSQEKEPWKSIQTLTGTVEQHHLFPTYLGETVLPYRTHQPRTAALPIVNNTIQTETQIEGSEAFNSWWQQAETAWNEHKSQRDDSRLLDRIDFHGQLSAQLPLGGQLVCYTKAGTKLTAARVSDPRAVIDLKLYWTKVDTTNEARYLTAILNSRTLLDRVTPYQSRGLFGPRDFDKYVFRVPIPLFDSSNDKHTRLAELAEKAEQIAGNVDITGKNFQQARAKIREALEEEGLAAELEEAVADLLPATLTQT